MKKFEELMNVLDYKEQEKPSSISAEHFRVEKV